MAADVYTVHVYSTFVVTTKLYKRFITMKFVFNIIVIKNHQLT